MVYQKQLHIYISMGYPGHQAVSSAWANFLGHNYAQDPGKHKGTNMQPELQLMEQWFNFPEEIFKIALLPLRYAHNSSSDLD